MNRANMHNRLKMLAFVYVIKCAPRVPKVNDTLYYSQYLGLLRTATLCSRVPPVSNRLEGFIKHTRPKNFRSAWALCDEEKDGCHNKHRMD